MNFKYFFEKSISHTKRAINVLTLLNKIEILIIHNS